MKWEGCLNILLNYLSSNASISYLLNILPNYCPNILVVNNQVSLLSCNSSVFLEVLWLGFCALWSPCLFKQFLDALMKRDYTTAQKHCDESEYDSTYITISTFFCLWLLWLCLWPRIILNHPYFVCQTFVIVMVKLYSIPRLQAQVISSWLH